MIKRLLSSFLAITCAVLVTNNLAAQERVVHVYNWSDYIGKDTIEKFTKATGIKVVYDVYDSNETLDAKLLTGKTGYDIVVPSGGFLVRQINAGLYQRLDKSLLPNLKNIDPVILKALSNFDPKNEYAVPYFWGTIGLGVNVDMINKRMPNAPVNSLDIIFKPEFAQKFADCGIAMLDSPSDIFQIVLNYLGKDPHSSKKEDYDLAEKTLLAVRPYIKYFHSSRYIEDLANGNICMALGYSGDILIAATRAEEAAKNVTVAYHIPKEGTQLWIDSIAIPKDAPHPKEAHAFINFLLDPQIAADGVNFVTYASPNMAAKAYVDQKILNNPGVYPPADVMARLFSDKEASGDLKRQRTRSWTRVKTGR